MRIGLALIARDEEETLPTLLASIHGAFDRIVLLDTGSTDATRRVFIEWAEAQDGLDYEVAHFDWIDDFAAARNAADELLIHGSGERAEPLVDFTCWADCDDEIHGAQALRALAARAPAELAAYMADYEYAHDEHGNCVCLLRRERLVRAGRAAWTGRVHEAQAVQGPVQFIDPATARWIHRKPPTVEESSERNLRILTAWEAEEPENPRVLGYLGTEHLARARFAEAEPFLRRYLDLRTTWDEERAQIHRKLSVCLLARQDLDGAEDVALRALTVVPGWPDSYLTLAQVAHERREWAKCEAWARRVLEIGQPSTMLIINPLEYAFAPRVLLASALGGQMRVDEALEVAGQALSVQPGDAALMDGVRRWQRESKRQHTIQTITGVADLLVQHDEQRKALTLLEEACPYYVADDPQIVAYRSGLRERVHGLLSAEGQAEHYLEATELGIPEEHMQIVPGLSRAGFLLGGVREQTGLEEQIAA